MKITAILLALVSVLATGAEVSARQHVPARDGEQVVAYGADTVCKLGCWG